MRFLVRGIFKDYFTSLIVEEDLVIHSLLVYDTEVRGGREKKLKIDFLGSMFNGFDFSEYRDGDMLLISFSLGSVVRNGKYYNIIVGLDVMNYRLNNCVGIIGNDDVDNDYSEEDIYEWLYGNSVI